MLLGFFSRHDAKYDRPVVISRDAFQGIFAVFHGDELGIIDRGLLAGFDIESGYLFHNLASLYCLNAFPESGLIYYNIVLQLIFCIIYKLKYFSPAYRSRSGCYLPADWQF
jgi:hypothetical protein